MANQFRHPNGYVANQLRTDAALRKTCKPGTAARISKFPFRIKTVKVGFRSQLGVILSVESRFGPFCRLEAGKDGLHIFSAQGEGKTLLYGLPNHRQIVQGNSVCIKLDNVVTLRVL